MILRAVAVFSLATLPFSLSLWHRSHKEPWQYRWDLTLHTSLQIHMKSGVCGLNLVSMPRSTASRTYFSTPLNWDALANRGPLAASSRRLGSHWDTWLVFPFWLSSLLFVSVGITPILQGPVRRWWLRRQGRCGVCGYDLRGTEGIRCSECGNVFREDADPEPSEARS